MLPSKADLDLKLGMNIYVTDSPGIGGIIRQFLDDFIVEEISLEGIRIRRGMTGEKACQLQGSPGEYTWFILEKHGLDTVTAIRLIAKALGISYKRFSMAGLKDARAVTTQLISVHDIPPSKIEALSGINKRIIVHSPFTRPFPLRPGMLFGNHFTITVRKIEFSIDEVKERTSEVVRAINKIGGLPAFYGYQRFGTVRPNTHIIGRHILKGDFEAAVMELLAHPYPGEPEHLIELRMKLGETRDFKAALNVFPRSLSHELIVLNHLAKRPNDYIGALRKLPITIRRLFISAFQSYLFNRFLSRRLECNLPLKYAVIGDTVAITTGFQIKNVLEVNEKNIDYVNKKIRNGDMAVVLDVPGFMTRIREGPQGDIIKEVLAEEGIVLDDFKLRHMPEVAAKGTYRVSCFNPIGLKVKIYDDDANKGFTKVIFEFTLRKGLYATVVLREFMKPEDVLSAGF